MNASKLPLVCLVAWSLVAAQPALALITLDFDAGPGLPRVLGLGGLPVQDGSQVWIGAFSDGFDPALALGNPSLLEAQWSSFGSLETQAIFGESGRFGGSVSGSTAAFEGDRIWLWILETEDGAAPLPNWSNLRAHGVFSSLASHWVYPASADIGPFTALATSAVNEFAWGSEQSGNLQLAAPVPESAASSGVIGLAALALACAGARGSRKSSRRSNL